MVVNIEHHNSRQDIFFLSKNWELGSLAQSVVCLTAAPVIASLNPSLAA